MSSVRFGIILAWSLSMVGAQQDVGKGEINYFDNYIEVTGLGLPAKGVDAKSPQGYVTARRAAVVDANRNLAEMVSQIQIDSATLTELGQTVYDRVSQVLQARMRGAQIVSEDPREVYFLKGMVEVKVRYPLTGSGSVLNVIMPVVGPEIRKREEALALPRYVPPPVEVPVPEPSSKTPTVPAASVPEYDGLMIRVPEGFKPSVAPKIFTGKGELVYGPSDVAMDILISRGAAQYTNNEGKAKALLERMGAKAIIQVSAALRTDTDAEIGTDDAAKIHQANKKSAFLNKARVVFVVQTS